jgi:hypothetical protein
MMLEDHMALFYEEVNVFSEDDLVLNEGPGIRPAHGLFPFMVSYFFL